MSIRTNQGASRVVAVTGPIPTASTEALPARSASSRLGPARIVGLAAAAVYGWWLIRAFRTSEVGNGTGTIWMCLLIALLYVLPIAFIPLIGLSVRRVLKYSLVVVLVSLFAALAWANVEELLVARTPMASEQSESVQAVPRWFPFHERSLIYTINQGWQVR